MKKYTIGIVFDNTLTNVILIKKAKPDWQKDKLNFPGGKIEDNEQSLQCIIREFKEETNILVNDWQNIGRITNHENYFVDVFTTIIDSEIIPESITIEPVSWYDTNPLPDNLISNLHWLIPFALNIHKQGNADILVSGLFEYQYK